MGRVNMVGGRRRFSLLALALLAAICGRTGAQNTSKTISHCTDAKNCFSCFKQLECIEFEDGTQECKPCGWCTDEYDETNWDSDTYGECVVASPGMELCEALISPDSKGYCPESVCTVPEEPKKHDLCKCSGNTCPSIDLFMGLFSMEGFWLLLLLTLMFTMGVLSACMLNHCFRPTPREVIVIRDEQTPEESYVRME